MKNHSRFWGLALVLSFALAPFAFADSTEQVRVIKTDLRNHDTLIERLDGSRWMIQHNRICRSQNTEFPVELVWSGGKVTKMKVAANELCRVHEAFEYTGEALLDKKIKNSNTIRDDYQAELTYFNKKYSVHYGTGCRNIREFVGDKIYLSLPDGEFEGGTLYLPDNRGDCEMTFAKLLEEIPLEIKDETPEILSGVDYQAQNTKVYFYWDHPESRDKVTRYLVSYSRNRIEPDDYKWNEMPHLRQTKRNSYTIRRLQNGRSYYFYLAALYDGKSPSEWQEFQVTPVADRGFKNNPDLDEFEIELSETDDQFILSWPIKENVKKYEVKFYVNGKLKDLEFRETAENRYTVPKRSDYLYQRLRFTVRSVKLYEIGRSYYDGHFWSYRKE